MDGKTLRVALSRTRERCDILFCTRSCFDEDRADSTSLALRETSTLSRPASGVSLSRPADVIE